MKGCSMVFKMFELWLKCGAGGHGLNEGTKPALFSKDCRKQRQSLTEKRTPGMKESHSF
jgi:hypothetical protein